MMPISPVAANRMPAFSFEATSDTINEKNTGIEGDQLVAFALLQSQLGIGFVIQNRQMITDVFRSEMPLYICGAKFLFSLCNGTGTD